MKTPVKLPDKGRETILELANNLDRVMDQAIMKIGQLEVRVTALEEEIAACRKRERR
jgi:hypothetical protein